MRDMAAAVHAQGGIWIAPAAAGFDGRTLGTQRVIDRKDGQTLVTSLNNALASQPDAVGVISWNEWSENTYIEPGQKFGDRELAVLRDYLHNELGTISAAAASAGADSSQPGTSGWTGAQAAMTLGGLVILTSAALGLYQRFRRRPAKRPDARSVGKLPAHAPRPDAKPPLVR
jgi:hypothetical protein